MQYGHQLRALPEQGLVDLEVADGEGHSVEGHDIRVYTKGISAQVLHSHGLWRHPQIGVGTSHLYLPQLHAPIPMSKPTAC